MNMCCANRRVDKQARLSAAATRLSAAVFVFLLSAYSPPLTMPLSNVSEFRTYNVV